MKPLELSASIHSDLNLLHVSRSKLLEDRSARAELASLMKIASLLMHKMQMWLPPAPEVR